MHETNIRTLDLSLLISLKALLEEKHVSRAAEKVGLSQPAMSRALARLRVIFKDALLVKGESGLTLTIRASNLLHPLKRLIDEVNIIVNPPMTNPAKMRGEIIVAIRDNELVSIMPPIIHKVLKLAPGIKFRLIPPLSDDFGQLNRQEVDFILTPQISKSETLFRFPLYKETFVCLVSTKNSIIKKNFDMNTYLSLKHCIVTTTGYGPGIVGRALAKQGYERDMSVQLSNYLSASRIIAQGDLIITVPRRVALLMMQYEKLLLLETPFKIPSFPVYLYWHGSNQNNPMHKWIRNIIKENCNTY